MSTQACSKCFTIKEFKYFNLSKRTASGYTTCCKDCNNKRTQAYYQTNKEQVCAKTKEYREAHQEQTVANRKARHERNREHHNKVNKAYSQTEKGRLVARNTNSNRRLLKQEGDVTTSELVELRNNASTCYWCHTIIIGNNFHVDHIYPLVKGGKHTISNLAITCPKCNMSKGAKLPNDFAILIAWNSPL